MKSAEYATTLPQVAEAAVEVLFCSTVAKDLDAIFRRSDAWKAGAEHVLVAGAAAGQRAAACAEYVSTLAQVAESPAVGALQSCAGAAPRAALLDAASGGAAGASDLGAASAMMSRFGSVAEADDFLQLPPCGALRTGDARCPGVALVDVVFEIEAVEQESSSAVASGL